MEHASHFGIGRKCCVALIHNRETTVVWGRNGALSEFKSAPWWSNNVFGPKQTLEGVGVLLLDHYWQKWPLVQLDFVLICNLALLINSLLMLPS